MTTSTAGGAAAGGEVWTIARVVQWAAKDFGGRGLESPRLDAELLLAHVLGCDRVRLIIEAQRPLTTDELASYRELIKRRRSGEPVAYLLGHREFYGLSFRVTPSVLVPRQDTEVLVEVALEATRARYMYGRALDLCTGSGCVAIAFARQRPTWSVTGTDVSPAALAVARENALRLGAIHNTAFVAGDLFAAVPADEGEGFALITANPPYIPRAVIPTLDVTVRGFEPHLALDGGEDGLDLVRRIVAEAPARLAPGGVLAVEIAYDQGPRTAELFGAAGLSEVTVHRDYGGRERVVAGRRALQS